MLVVNVVHLLLVREDTSLSGFFFTLHDCIIVPDLGIQILDLFTSVLVEVVDQIVLDLHRVALH